MRCFLHFLMTVCVLTKINKTKKKGSPFNFSFQGEVHGSWNDYGLQWRMSSLCKYVFAFNTKCNFVPVKWSLNSYVFLLSLERFIKLYRLSRYVGCFDNKWLFSSKQLCGKFLSTLFFLQLRATLWVATIYFPWVSEKKREREESDNKPSPTCLNLLWANMEPKREKSKFDTVCKIFSWKVLGFFLKGQII